MKISRLVIFLAIVFLFISSCSIVKFPKIQKISNVRIDSQTDSCVYGQFNVTILNPNFFSFTVKHLSYKAYVNKFYLGKGSIDTTVKFKSHSAQKLNDLRFSVQSTNLDEIFYSLPTLDSMPIKFFIKARIKGIIFPVFWIKTINLDLKQALAALVNWHNVFALTGTPWINIDKIGFRNTQVTVKLTLKNNFPVAFSFDTVKLKFYDKYDNFIGSSQLLNVHVLPYSQTPLPFKISIDNMLLAVSLLGQYIDENFEIKIKGYLIFRLKNNTIKVPINEKISAKIKRIDNY